ncbi:MULTISPECIES: hypothetical protein [unclassified Mesorhizobium]|uniref:hypothetical protein n=1 Tax=unclassified Mesorhizobium TaxID=325217 RepID=UPI00112A51F3|nr:MULTISPECIES: hypothetical protein [unclassified Mesorhizobium]TPJ45343.1 hypothetical protein FJ437_18275 [Mesorhizobium sp. B2-6-6]MCA0002016.1 hypothetical protein [Mesorhizobium sp. B264B2A]MCA0006691.1 hypothetical protein [Mesorhizobium sp. B264B1B]MCA0017676.1 hypothetical protein [Mesorhizobium sp. B264B1A]TPJ65356.1 hypothetical protein FJ443_05425 [Mesorhizobium sp. B2-6-1]
MNVIIRTTVSALVAASGFTSVSSFAQDVSCSCAAAYRGPASAIGSIRSADGDVMVSQSVGYGPAKAGSTLGLGSRVVVGTKGSASVLVGGCNMNVPANSSLDVSRVGGNICLKLVGSERTAAIQPSGGTSGFGLPEGIFAGALVTSGVLAATQDDDKAVSR